MPGASDVAVRETLRFYGFIEILISDLRNIGQIEAADEVERALREGSTSGADFTYLGVALEKLKDRPVDREGVNEALVVIRRGLGVR
jgi:hypothetical protein